MAMREAIRAAAVEAIRAALQPAAAPAAGTPTLPAGYSAEVLANGRTLQVTFPSFTAPAVYSLTPDATAKVTLAVTTKTYSGTTLGTSIKTIVGTKIYRKPHPNEADKQETQDGSDVIAEFSLSDPVYQTDTILMTVLSGWATDSAGGGGESAETFSNISITNSSTRQFKPCITRWNIPNEKNYWDGTGTLTVSVCAFSTHPSDLEMAAAATFTITDGSNSTTKTVTQSTLSSQYPEETANGTRVIEFSADFDSDDIAGFSDGQCYVDAVVYPKRGDVLAESNPSVGSAPQGLERFEVYLDVAGNRPPLYTKVNPGIAGANPAVHTSRAAALADADGAYATYAAAKTAIAAYNNANHSYNGSGNGHVIIVNGSHDNSTFWGTSAADTDAQSVWMEVEAETAGSVTLSDTASHFSILHPLCVKITDITFTQASNLVYVYKNNNGGANRLWLNNCDGDATSATDANMFLDNGIGYITGGSYADMSLSSTGTNEHVWKLIRGISADNCLLQKYCTMGISGTNNTRLVDPNAQSDALYDHADNRILHAVKLSGKASGNTFFDYDEGSGLAIVNVVLEDDDASTNAMAGVGQNTTADMDNVVVAGLTSLGARINIGYDNGVTDRSRTDFVMIGLATDTINTKHDTNADDADNVSAWEVLYGVGSYGNAFIRGYDDPGNAFEYPGRNTAIGSSGTPLSVTFTDDASANTGDGTGGGDYSLVSAGDLGGRIPSGRGYSRFDIAGSARNNDGTGAAGAYEAA